MMRVELDATLFDRIEQFLESLLPNPEAAAILQALDDAEIERNARALRERFVISEPTSGYSEGGAGLIKEFNRKNRGYRPPCPCCLQLGTFEPEQDAWLCPCGNVWIDEGSDRHA